jgi:Tol biopolymer transport system component
MPFVHPPLGKLELSRVLRILAVVCIAGLVAGVSPALGAFPGANGKIAFDGDRHGGDSDIWTMNPNGSNLDNLTPNSDGEDSQANWRADGRKIVFMSNRETPRNPIVPVLEAPDFEVFVMNADGSRQTQITYNELDDENAAWSPDGKRIVVQRDFDPVLGEVDYDVLTMKANGSDEQNITNSPGVIDQEPNWEPNGGKIAFSSDRDGDFEVYTMRPNGSSPQQLTFADGLDGAPNWSPDGRRIAFDSERDGDAEIYRMRADGSDQTRLTTTLHSDILPAWSPNGRRIAFASFRDGNAEIYTMRFDGSEQVNRTNNAAFDWFPDWQPLDDRGDDD